MFQAGIYSGHSLAASAWYQGVLANRQPQGAQRAQRDPGRWEKKGRREESAGDKSYRETMRNDISMLELDMGWCACVSVCVCVCERESQRTFLRPKTAVILKRKRCPLLPSTSSVPFILHHFLTFFPPSLFRSLPLSPTLPPSISLSLSLPLSPSISLSLFLSLY